MKKIIVLVVASAYFGVVLLYNLTDYEDIWKKINRGVDITYTQLEKAKEQIYSMDNSEFDQKLEKLKDIIEQKIEDEVTSPQSMEDIMNMIREDIEFLNQDYIYDITISDYIKEIMAKRIEELEDLLEKAISDENGFTQVQIEYQKGLDKFVELYNMITTGKYSIM